MIRWEDLWVTTAGQSNSFRMTLGLQSVQESTTKTGAQLIHLPRLVVLINHQPPAVGKPVKAVLAPYSDPNPYGGSPTGAYDKRGRPIMAPYSAYGAQPGPQFYGSPQFQALQAGICSDMSSYGPPPYFPPSRGAPPPCAINYFDKCGFISSHLRTQLKGC